MRRRKWRGFPKSIVLGMLILLSIVGGFGGAELWFRVKGDPPGMDRYQHPYIMIGGFHPGGYFGSHEGSPEAPEAFGYVHSGILGAYDFDESTEVASALERGRFLYRDRARFADLKDGSLRIFVLGGSVAFGEGASALDKRWFVRLEKILTKKLRRTVHVIPAANHSHVSTQERIVLDLYVLPKHPDAIVFLSGFNDANTYYATARPGDPFGQGVDYRRYESPFYGFLTDIAKHSYLFHRLLLNDLYRSRRQRSGDMEKLAKSVANVFLDNELQMKRRCELEKIPCFFFLQPTQVLTILHRKGDPNNVDRSYVRPYERILALKKNLAPFLHDLTGVFDDGLQAVPFIDPAHFNNAGHETIARAIADVMLKSGLLK